MENDSNAPQNNQPPQLQQPPVVGPPQVPPEPQEPPHKPSVKQLVIGIAFGVVLLAIAGFLIVGNDSNKTLSSKITGTPTLTAKDWLSPTSEIKVGTHRYVSTCQVLPLDSVVKTMYDGKPPQSFAVDEQYYDESPTEEKFIRPKTRCEYGDAATLNAEQYFVASEAKRLSNSVSSLGSKYLEGKVAAYRRAANTTNDAALKKFVSQLEASAKTFAEKKDAYSSSETNEIDTNILIIPTGTDAIEFTLFSNNIVYELTLPSKIRASQIADAPADQLVQPLKQAKSLIDVIYKNNKNPQLSQSPAPTLLSDKAQVGQTYVVEPCAVLSPAVMKSITGVENAYTVARRSVPYDLNSIQKPKAGYAIYPRNECSRTIKQGTETGYTKTTAQFEVEYAPDAAALDEKLTNGEFLPLDADDTQLQTKADFAAEYVVGTFDPYYQFRVGNYWTQLKLSTIDSNGTQGQLSREKYVAAINTLVDSLKVNVKEAESSQGR